MDKAARAEARGSGLPQAQDACGFSLDALLLGAFAQDCLPRWSRLLDLGCGSGPVAFYLLLQAARLYPEAPRAVLGLDIQEELLTAAADNARRLGLERQFSAAREDLRLEGEARAQGFDLVTANPPYHATGRGRLPASAGRRLARHGDAATLRGFLRRAAFSLSAAGLFCLIFPIERQAELLEGLKEWGLYPARLLPVQSRPGGRPFRLLLAATLRRLEQPGQEKTLVLYAEKSGAAMSGEAARFCPCLAPQGGVRADL